MENKELIEYKKIIPPVAELIKEKVEKLQDDAHNYKHSLVIRLIFLR
jgi:hypothetical protein